MMKRNPNRRCDVHSVDSNITARFLLGILRVSDCPARSFLPQFSGKLASSLTEKKGEYLYILDVLHSSAADLHLSTIVLLVTLSTSISSLAPFFTPLTIAHSHHLLPIICCDLFAHLLVA
jgi:hypothetical protein